MSTPGPYKPVAASLWLGHSVFMTKHHIHRLGVLSILTTATTLVHLRPLRWGRGESRRHRFYRTLFFSRSLLLEAMEKDIIPYHDIWCVHTFSEVLLSCSLWGFFLVPCMSAIQDSGTVITGAQRTPPTDRNTSIMGHVKIKCTHLCLVYNFGIALFSW